MSCTTSGLPRVVPYRKRRAQTVWLYKLQVACAAGGAVDWSAYRDQAAQDLRALLDIKLQGQPAAAQEPARMVLPLLAALQQSVAAAAQADDGAAPRGKGRAPRKRTKRTA